MTEESFPEEVRLFTSELGLTDAHEPPLWSYSYSFRLLFWCAGIAGGLSALAALIRLNGLLSAP